MGSIIAAFVATAGGTATTAQLTTVALTAAAATTTAGQIQQGKAAEAQGKSEQAILEHNARIAEEQAEDERTAAKTEAEKFAEQGRRLMGTQRVQLARGGVLSTEGTPALLLEQTAQELEQERLDILTEGFRRGEFRESEAFGLRFQGTSARASGSNIRRGSTLAATGTLLTGLGQVGLASSSFTKSTVKPPVVTWT